MSALGRHLLWDVSSTCSSAQPRLLQQQAQRGQRTLSVHAQHSAQALHQLRMLRLQPDSMFDVSCVHVHACCCADMQSRWQPLSC